jgi:uncharacterized membrane protein
MNTRAIAASTAGLGAGLVYLFDPKQGRRRRARVRDAVVHGAHVTADGVGKTWRDVRNRTTGLIARAERTVKREPITDEVLAERVREKLGHTVSHPHQVEVGAAHGRVTLRGPILAHEVDRLLAVVRAMRGVVAVDNELVSHERADDVPALQGGTYRTGHTVEFFQTRWAPAARLLASVVGGALALYGMRRRGLTGSALSLVGGTLVTRALTNLELGELTGLGGGRGIAVQKTLTVHAPVERVYDVWSHPERFPHVMSRVREVHPLGRDRYHWRVAGPAGIRCSWSGVITRQMMNKLIEFRSDPGSVIDHEGSVRFEPSADGSTRVDVKMSYRPPGGVIGHAVAALLGADPRTGMTADLMRMKTFIETGRPPHDAAGRHAPHV